ncbi:MAG: hypothetical protein ACE5I1_19805 [bacterium]
MKKFHRKLKTRLIPFFISMVLAIPVFASLSACGDEINGPRVEEDKPDGENRQGGTEGD